MKVSINNKPLPKPFIGAFINTIGGIAGSAIDANSAEEQQERQIQHDKDMAALNQQNTLAQMEQQNKYQVEQWNRENEYNDPSAVAARYRAAGVNPRSALGGAASGAGIAGGLSSAPSGGNTGTSSNVMYGTNFAGGLSNIGSTYLESRRTDAEVAHKNAETAEQIVENEYKEQNLVADLLIKRGEYEKLVADKSLSESQRDHYKKLIEGVDQQIAESEERIKGYSVQRENVAAQTENTRSNTNKVKTETELEENKLAFEEKFNGAPIELLNSTPGASAFISYAVTNQVERGVEGLRKFVDEVHNNPRRFPDPVKDFVLSNLPKLKDYFRMKLSKSKEYGKKYIENFGKFNNPY